MAVRAFYSHTSPEGGQPWDRAAAAGSTRRSIGENIACGQRSAAEVVEGWMNSPGHRANILKPGFTHIGVGFAGGGPRGHVLDPAVRRLTSGRAHRTRPPVRDLGGGTRSGPGCRHEG